MRSTLLYYVCCAFTLISLASSSPRYPPWRYSGRHWLGGNVLRADNEDARMLSSSSRQSSSDILMPDAIKPDLIGENNKDDISSCVNQCQKYQLYIESPVCGDNGHTYDNISHLLCAQYCGEAVYSYTTGEC